MEEEIWKSVPNYMGYEVSSRGRVRSLDRTNSLGHKIKGGVRKASISPQGYLRIILSSNGVKKTYGVHQLVAMSFLGHVPNGRLIVVDHIDGDKLNNNLNNLQVITARENTARGVRGATSKYVGASWNTEKEKWKSQITIDGKGFHLGYFTNEIDAHNAYQKKLAEISK